MGREVRRVSGDWEHPKDERDNFVPLEEADMPEWTEAQKTHLMMYENTSEGTPISPGFEEAEELAQWLADTGASAFGDSTASFEQWLCAINDGYAPSMVFDGKRGLCSGVEAACDVKEKAH